MIWPSLQDSPNCQIKITVNISTYMVFHDFHSYANAAILLYSYSNATILLYSYSNATILLYSLI